MKLSKVRARDKITLSLAAALIAEQFPEWASLPITSVDKGGWDNVTFRLGEDMLIRLPSAEEYVPQVQKEQEWLPVLAPHILCQIPKPLAMGKPSADYPWHWSIYQWIEGESANLCGDFDQVALAKQLAQFLRELQQIDATGGPKPGLHNFFRGDRLSIYDSETRKSIEKLKGIIDVDVITSVWERAINTHWGKDPVWVHGDFSSGNILIKNEQLSAVIDFGCMGLGDPACDLVIAWTYLDDKGRDTFQSKLNLDQDAWDRARGWALWKALITLADIDDRSSREALEQLRIISLVAK